MKATRTKWFAVTALAITLAAGSVKAQVTDSVIKIGVMNDMSGINSVQNGIGGVVAAQMAIDDFGGTVLGKKIELTVNPVYWNLWLGIILCAVVLLGSGDILGLVYGFARSLRQLSKSLVDSARTFGR